MAADKNVLSPTKKQRTTKNGNNNTVSVNFSAAC